MAEKVCRIILCVIWLGFSLGAIGAATIDSFGVFEFLFRPLVVCASSFIVGLVLVSIWLAAEFMKDYL